MLARTFFYYFSDDAKILFVSQILRMFQILVLTFVSAKVISNNLLNLLVNHMPHMAIR